MATGLSGALGMLNPNAARPKDWAQQTFAELTRQQWDDYLRNFVPLENLQIQYAMSPNTVTQAVSNARGDVADSFATQQGITERRMRGLGLQLNPDEQRAVDRSSGIAQSLADVSAVNLTTQRVKDRQQSILGNPAPTLGGA